ncbi:hypothetical protein D3C78_786330 [compost metagenome]
MEKEPLAVSMVVNELYSCFMDRSLKHGHGKAQVCGMIMIDFNVRLSVMNRHGLMLRYIAVIRSGSALSACELQPHMLILIPLQRRTQPVGGHAVAWRHRAVFGRELYILIRARLKK